MQINKLSYSSKCLIAKNENEIRELISRIKALKKQNRAIRWGNKWSIQRYVLMALIRAEK